MTSTRLAVAFLAGSAVVAAIQHPPAAAEAPGDGRDLARGLSGLFQDVARETGRAVVSVSARGPRRRGAAGSGVLVAPEGVVVTNHHVVAGAEDIRVTLWDGRRLEAEVRGTDPDTDLAVLTIMGDGGFPHAQLAAGEPEVGEWVLALGNPLGLGTSVTFGIVGGVDRTGLGVATFEGLLQTDAAINPGNSGGPLVDLDGRVVGINTAKGLGGGSESGLGFAIPGARVRRVVDAVLRDGEVLRGWLGVHMLELSPRAAGRLGLEARSHVSVRAIVPDSPAEAADLRAGDVLLELDGVPVRETRDLLESVAERTPGSDLAVRVWREGEEVTIHVRLGTRPAADAEPDAPPSAGAGPPERPR